MTFIECSWDTTVKSTLRIDLSDARDVIEQLPGGGSGSVERKAMLLRVIDRMLTPGTFIAPSDVRFVARAIADAKDAMIAHLRDPGRYRSEVTFGPHALAAELIEE